MNDIYIESESMSVKSFSENLIHTREKIHKSYFVENFSRDEVRQVESLCVIIADVLCLSPKDKINIAGEVKRAENVQEVYSMIDERHIETVLENFSKITFRVKNIKSYMRTALYNAVLELGNREENDANARFGK